MQNPNQLERLVWSGDQTGNRGDYQFVSAPRPLGVHPVEITVDGAAVPAEGGEWLIDSILRVHELAHVCYHPQMGPIQSCDTCMVEVDGKLVRACGIVAVEGMNVVTSSPRADAAQREALRSGYVKSLLPLRSRPMYSLRPLCAGLPDPPGK